MNLVAGAFLAGLALLAVPLLLHRLKERSPAETTVSSLMLMREAEEPARTRRALAHRVLLALRLALLAALTLAFAQPVMDALAGPRTGEAAAPADLVVLDVSLSMRRSSAWSRALDVARDLQGDPGGGGRLILAGDRLTAVPAVVDAEPGWSRLDYSGLPQRIEAALAAWPTPPGGWRVHLVSDFQASAAPERFNALVEGIQWPVDLHVVGDHGANWAVAAHMVPAAARSGDGGPDDVARIEAVVTSFAPSRRQLAVSLHRDGGDGGGEEVDRATVAVAAGGRTPVTFDVPTVAREAVAWEVRLGADDALPEDDVARVVQSGRDATRLAILAPNRQANAQDTAMRFLKAALAASGFAEPTLLDTDSVWRQADVDCLILLDPGSLPGSTERRLARYTDAGGGVLTIVGPRTSRARALPFGGEVESSVFDTKAQVVVRDAGHPLAAGGWGEVAVDRALALPNGYGETILSLVPRARDRVPLGVGGQPMLIEQRLGAGRMVILLTALDREWSTLVLKPAFVGFVANAVGYLAGEFARAGHAGEPLPVTSGNVQLFDAQGVRVLALGDTAGGSGNVLRVAEPGLYTVRTPGRETLLAVNVDPRESDLAPMSADVLERWQDAAQRGAPAAGPVVQAATGEPTGTPLGPMLLALGLALLLVESAAANVGRVRPRAWIGGA